MSDRVRLEGVHKRFGDKHVLKGIDLSVAEHDVVCLIGSSGSGKSTILRCINLLETVDEGAIYLDGEIITRRETDPNLVRQFVGIVFQSYNLFPHMNVLDNVTLSPRRVHGKGRVEAEDHAVALLERFGLSDKVYEFPDRLSGGQQQRVAVVRALATEPELLLLDEITAALDPELVGEVLGVIRDLITDGMTLILATHEMGFARDVATRVCFLDDGAILEEGPPDQFFSDPQMPRTQQFLRRVIDAGRL
ncbi:ABC transporter, ATP-binding protein (cluster 3, basic aa/glutamine/opines) [hydrothermal vent metagenome]|uniref:ABC transporter, ATP-binding protein (Cluster 3, basic aa/glutamine/opines) n=2 Tax=hydrothermal vent metagenome TaxID=652676 RepID=A0A3B0SJX5_9ZZZZ